MAKNPWETSREVVERIFISAKLHLDTPTHIGNGDSDALTDIPLLFDPLDPKRPLLTGSSIAGALRAYLREYEAGYRQPGHKRLKESALFGYLDGYTASMESWLMVDDAYGASPAKGDPVEIRDGVSINASTRTAEDQKKFDTELLAAGTTFDLHFELWLPGDKRDQLLAGTAVALRGLEQGEIGIGMRKRRGFGQCHVEEWRVARYDMSNPEEIVAWLTHQDGQGQITDDILAALDIQEVSEHAGRKLSVDATFALSGSMLIRSDSGEGDAPDAVHLRSYRDGDPVPVLSGTSLAGAMRGRALRITNTLGISEAIIDSIFGKRIRDARDKPRGSRFIVRETTINHAIEDRVQSRVKLDRFTGGAYPQALFSQQPLWARDGRKSIVTIHFELLQNGEKDFAPEVGLMLLLLKDLWTGDLPLGGESSVGRGRLQGVSATITLDDNVWIIEAAEGKKLAFSGIGDPDQLQSDYLDALKELQP